MYVELLNDDDNDDAAVATSIADVFRFILVAHYY